MRSSRSTAGTATSTAARSRCIDIRRGSNPNINIAIVRRIIEIIRDHEQGDFRWDSKRLGRDLTLSARPADNAELETFMMQEFFLDSGRPR